MAFIKPLTKDMALALIKDGGGTLGTMTVRKRWIPPSARGTLPFISQVSPIATPGNKDPLDYKIENTVLITADGHTLLDDLKEFESWDIPHDLFCVNKSLNAVIRPVNHWAAIDAEEAFWFAEQSAAETRPEGHKLARHTIGICRNGYDCFWRIRESTRGDERGLLMWSGSTTYFAVLASVWMKYDKIIIAGAPLDMKNHWYEPPGDNGPRWNGEFYMSWMDFAQRPEAKAVKSLSGYSAFILGKATKEWVNGK